MATLETYEVTYTTFETKQTVVLTSCPTHDQALAVLKDIGTSDPYGVFEIRYVNYEEAELPTDQLVLFTAEDATW